MKNFYNMGTPLGSDLLRTFLAVARYRNVTRAAEAINLTQSAVSVQIKRLEECLGTTLFRRWARGVSLTGAGDRLHSAAQRIVEDLDQTARAFRNDPIGGVVRIGIPDEYGSDILPVILADFTARHPAVEVIVRCGLSMEFPKAVENGDLDLAVFTRECAPGAMRILFEEPTVWACLQGFLIEQRKPIPLALFDRSCWWRDAAVAALKKSGRSYRIAYSSESVAGIKAAINAGLALGALPRSVVEPSMRILRERDGFPVLPKTGLSLLQSADSRAPATVAMSEAIERGFSRLA